ncbi:MAG: sigma-70 family RNA polymerase sigma factor [Bacteriovoracaceae bacterium]|jgi:RNA polymerase sigma-70 factor (ECF subfamily)|nr:hypothetical protein [Halobacteriovoraceae bacterium]MDP7319086.1 sigma-70 family RNA polymerase sigma factor [Bacteriovoracaceae bacterium]
MNFNSSQFIERLRARDTKTLSELVEKYHQALYLGALKLKLSDDQAEEVVQATWSTFIENIENFQNRSHIRTYLFGIMYNKVKEQWRSNKRYTLEHNQDLDFAFTENGDYRSSPMNPDIWLQSSQFLDLLEKELQLLPENQRLAFTLKEVLGEKTEDICKILDITNTHLGVLIYRAKNQLRIRIEKQYVIK